MSARRHVHPSIFAILYVPFGALGGFLTVTVIALLSSHGVSLAQSAVITGAALIPNWLKFLWGPVLDSTLTQKRWYVIGAIGTAVTAFAMGALPMTAASVPALTWLNFFGNILSSIVGMTTNAIVAYDVPDAEKGRASGWSQAGNLGGSGIGGGFALYMAQRVHVAWLPGAAIALLCLACAFALLLVEEPATPRSHRILADLRATVVDVWHMARARMGLLALVLSLLPIGSGAASNLWSNVALEWKASEDTVALWTGFIAGIVMMVGSLAGGWICDRMNRKGAYALFGVLQAASAVAMGALPHTERMFIVNTTIYSLVTGLTYAGFYAFVFEAVGTGAAATKVSVAVSLSNFPIWYMTLLDGWVGSRWHDAWMLYVEAMVGLLGLALFVGFAAIVQRRWPKHWPQTVEDALAGAAAVSDG
jgi:MFS family permease